MGRAVVNGPARLLLLVLFVGLAGCGRHGKAAPKGGSEVPPSQTKLKRNVELAKAQRDSIEVFVETVGYLEPEGQTPIAAGVPGILDEILPACREGQWVEKGTLLALVDQRRYQAALDVARANELKADTALKLAKDLAQRAERAGRGATDEERDKTRLGASIAEAELESTRAARVLAEHNLFRSRVRAPYAGQINQRLVSPGTYLEDKTVIATIADERRIRLVGWVPEKATPIAREFMTRHERLRGTSLAAAWFAGRSPWAGLAEQAIDSQGGLPAGFNLRFRLVTYPNREFQARIFYLSRVANPDTHMFECKAEIDQRGLDVEMKPGYTARIRCPLRTNPNAVVIPEESVRASEQGNVVFVPERRVGRDGQAEWVARARQVELGYRAPGRGTVEVLHGVEPGQWIVRKGAEALEDGTPISPPEVQLRELVQVAER